LAFAASLAACHSGSKIGLLPSENPDLAPAAQPMPQVVIKAATSQAGLDAAGMTFFHLMSMNSLFLRLQVPSLPTTGANWVTQQIYNPYGGLYSERFTPYSTDGSMTEVAPLHDVGHQVEVLRPRKLVGGFGLDDEILIAGSSFVTRSIPGLWRIVMFMEDQPGVRAELIVELSETP
jgi:hypothetical protein